MKNTDPVELLLVALVAIAWAAVTIARTLLVPAVALLITVAHPPEHRSKPRGPLLPGPWLPPTVEALEGRTVAKLRAMAQAAGLPRALCRLRKAELSLALAAMAW